MGSETRKTQTVRPFAISRSFASLLSQTMLRFGKDTCEAGGRLTIFDPELHVRKRAEIQWTRNDESFGAFTRTLADAAAASGLDLSALALLVTAATPYLKITDIVHQASCADLDAMPRVVVLTEPDRPAPFCAPHHGATVEVFLLLTRSLEPRPLRPWRRGTWLARETFKIATEQSQRLFHPKPLDDETRREFGLPRKTMHYVRMDDADPLEPYDAGTLELYVDRELLNDISARPRSPVSQAIQLQLAQDVIAAIVHAAAARGNDLEDRTFADLGDSLLARVLRIASKAGGTPDHLLGEVVHDPSRIIAYAGAATGFLAKTREAVRDGES